MHTCIYKCLCDAFTKFYCWIDLNINPCMHCHEIFLMPFLTFIKISFRIVFFRSLYRTMKCYLYVFFNLLPYMLFMSAT